MFQNNVTDLTQSLQGHNKLLIEWVKLKPVHLTTSRKFSCNDIHSKIPQIRNKVN